MIAYHFTSLVHLEQILKDGEIHVTSSCTDPWNYHADPPVVWMLDAPGLDGLSHGLTVPEEVGVMVADKTEVMIAVDVPDRWVTPWSSWLPIANPRNPGWIRTLSDTAGGPEATKHWRISFRPIPQSQWLEITNTKTGEVLWTSKTSTPTA